MISTIMEWFRDKNQDREVPLYVNYRGGFYVKPEDLMKSKKFKEQIEYMDKMFIGEKSMNKTKQRNHLIYAIDIIGQIKGHIEINTTLDEKYLGKLDHIRNCLTDYLHADEIGVSNPENEHLLLETNNENDTDLTSSS